MRLRNERFTTSPAGTRLRFEPLESRLLLAGETYLINFQLAGTPVPTGYLADYGEVFAPRGNGLSYGWSSDHTDVSRDRNVDADQRLDTLVHFHEDQVWELALPNGTYSVLVSIGDPQHNSTHTLNVEGVRFWGSIALNPGDFLSQSREVEIADGRLTLDQGSLPDKGTRIDYIQIVELPDGPNNPPAVPTINEPSAARDIDPADVPMQVAEFSDSDGDGHLSTDWEIWTTGAGEERVWQGLGQTGDGRTGMALAGGVFENGRAGSMQLSPLTRFRLQVRFRDDAGAVSDWATHHFLTDEGEIDESVPFAALQPGYEIDVVADGFQLPTNIAFVPEPGPSADDPLFYVTELYGNIKVVTNDFSVNDYATGLLNFNPTGNFPGSGEQGLAGIVVDPQTGDVIVTRVTSSIPFDDSAPHHPQVVRFSSNDGGRTAATESILLNMVGESQGQSHQISNVTIGPDGKLYVHNGDGFNANTAQNLNSYRGKILRMNLDGTAPSDNPFYNANNGINSRDYVFAYGVRNPFGGAWRASDGNHYSVENGPSIDRLARIDEGVNYGWNGSNSSMRTNAIYVWNPAHAPVNITFVEPETFHGSGFPLDKMNRAFVSESGPTYANGPQARGKRIVEFELDDDGELVSGPTTLVEYVGTGRASVVGLIAGPDGLYFTDLYKDQDAATPIDPGARVYRVRYNAQPGDYDGNGSVGQEDLDLVLLEWGNRAEDVPLNWITNSPEGNVDQDELDAVLLHWGQSSSGLTTASSQVASATSRKSDALTSSARTAARSNAEVDRVDSVERKDVMESSQFLSTHDLASLRARAAVRDLAISNLKESPLRPVWDSLLY